MDDLVIRFATVENIKKLSKLDKETNSTYWNMAKYSACFNENSLNRVYILQYKTSNEIIGCLVVDIILHEASILQFWVSRQHKKRGFGKYFLSYVLNELLVAQVRKIFLEVAEDNLAAIRLYKKAGFKNIYRREKYYNINGCFYDAVVMSLDLY